MSGISFHSELKLHIQFSNVSCEFNAVSFYYTIIKLIYVSYVAPKYITNYSLQNPEWVRVLYPLQYPEYVGVLLLLQNPEYVGLLYLLQNPECVHECCCCVHEGLLAFIPLLATPTPGIDVQVVVYYLQ
jgi:hypothetical protein